ncbi:MAG: hypothetical protein ACFN4M_10500, partial [Segatella salivae]
MYDRELINETKKYSVNNEKVYVKPCSLSVAVDFDHAMLAGSGVTVSNQNLNPHPHQTLGGPGSPAKMNPFADDEEETN